MAVDPPESVRIAIDLVQSRQPLIKLVQIPHQPLQPLMVRAFREQVPVQTPVVIPLAPLAELSSHEQKLLPRMPIHEDIEAAQVGELLPVIARHLSEQ